jgi:hypothetical protein
MWNDWWAGLGYKPSVTMISSWQWSICKMPFGRWQLSVLRSRTVRVTLFRSVTIKNYLFKTRNCGKGTWTVKSGTSVPLRSKFSKTATPKLTEEWKPVPWGTFLTWKSSFENYFPGVKFVHDWGTLSTPEEKRLMALPKINISCKVRFLLWNSIARWVTKN